MLRPYVELSNNPPSHEIHLLPGGMATIVLYENPELMETTEDGTERWRALCYTITVPNVPGLTQRVATSVAAWLEKAKETATHAAACEARAKRDHLLRDCDYTIGNDYPATDTEHNAWRAYRQALRDVPEQAGFPWEIEWPAVPEREKADDTILGTIDELIGGENV